MRHLLTASAIAAALAAPQAWAQTLEGVGTYKGNAGFGTPNGDVTAPPTGSSYLYVSTFGGVSATDEGIGFESGSKANGSELATFVFNAERDDVLSYFFNFVTTDGAGFSDYAYAYLLDTVTDDRTPIFTARTTADGDTVPGFDLPAIDPGVTLLPATTPIIPGAPTWAELGDDSGACFDAGCGRTGWIESRYTIPTTGFYRFVMGVVNWNDEEFDTGLAVAGLRVGETEIIPSAAGDATAAVPAPAAAPLLLTGLGVLAWMRRRRRAA